jgi:hypothetical protein
MGDGTTVVEIENDQLVIDQDETAVQVAVTDANQTLSQVDQELVLTEEITPITIDGEDAEAIALVVGETETLTHIESPIQVLNTEDQELLVTTESTEVLVEEMLGIYHTSGVKEFYVQDTAPDAGATTPYLWIETGLGPGGNDFTFWFEDGA